MPDGETQVADGAGAVRLDEDVLRLEVSVSDRRLTLSPDNLHVQMGEARRDRETHAYHSVRVHGRTVQVIKQRSLLVVVGYQPQLRPRAVV